MKKYLLIALLLLWIAALAILIIALTNSGQNNPFKEYRLLIGIFFIAVSGFIRRVYKNR